MRDIIWTVIVVWIVWKIYDAFNTLSRPRTRAYNPSGSQQQQQSYQQKTYQQQARREGEVRIENKGEPRTSHFKPDDGEYVDYEEIK